MRIWWQALAAPVFGAALLTGCAGAGQPMQTASVAPPQASNAATAAGPVSLISPTVANRAPPVEMALQDTQILPAINLYRFKNKLEKGPVQRAGADLNGDGSAEAVVYLDGPGCAETGCPLVVFAPTAQGYRVVSRTDGVVLPVSVAPDATGGWRDLVVGTATGQPVRLIRSGAGYPSSIMDGIAMPRDLAAASEMLLGTGDPSTAPGTASSALQSAFMTLATTSQGATDPVMSGNFTMGGDAAEGEAGQ